MGTKAAGDMCYLAAMPDEPMFVLLARDVTAPGLVRSWAYQRQSEIVIGVRPAEDQAKVDEALACADKMEAWRLANDGAWRNSQFQCGKAAEEPSEAAALPVSPWPVGSRENNANAKRAGWDAFWLGKGREQCPFPKARTDLQRDYRVGWDAANAGGTAQ